MVCPTQDKVVKIPSEIGLENYTKTDLLTDNKELLCRMGVPTLFQYGQGIWH